MENMMIQEIDLSNFRLGDIAEIQKAVKQSELLSEKNKTAFITLQLSEHALRAINLSILASEAWEDSMRACKEAGIE